MTEFALALPVFLLLLLGVIEFAWAIYGFNTIQSAANEGVRRAMVLSRPASNFATNGNSTNDYSLSSFSCDRFGTVMDTMACSLLTLPKNRITVHLDMPNSASYASGANVPSQTATITVTVRYEYAPLVGYVFNLEGKTMTGYATSQNQ